MPEVTNQNTQLGSNDWSGPLQIGDDAVRGYFSFLSTKAAAKGVSKTPPATFAVLIAGIVLLVFLLKR